MKNERTHAWAERLRTTNRAQVYGMLCKYAGSNIGMCCLGVGSELSGRASIDMKDVALPNGNFAVWLGLELHPGYRYELVESVDIIVDWSELDYPLPRGEEELPSYSELNDTWGLTFPQIADVVDYFGVEVGSVASSVEGI